MSHQDLKRLAEAATPGPWSPPPQGFDFDRMYNPEDFRGSVTQAALTANGVDPLLHVYGFGWSEGNLDADTAYIAAANPTVVLALLAEIEALREALGWFVSDERFQVAVGGNPQVVERMIEQARQVYAATIKQEQEDG